MNESEKVSTNLGVVELAQIDVLVEQGHYSNRSDFIRSAIRKELEINTPKIERHFARAGGEKWNWTLGIYKVSKVFLEELAEANDKLSITVIGMIIFESTISKQLFDKTVKRITIRGKIVAPDEIKEAIKDMNSMTFDQNQGNVTDFEDIDKIEKTRLIKALKQVDPVTIVTASLGSSPAIQTFIKKHCDFFDFDAIRKELGSVPVSDVTDCQNYLLRILISK